MKKVTLEELRPGMVLTEDVCCRLSYQVLLKAGSILTIPQINRLRRLSAEEFWVGDRAEEKEGEVGSRLIHNSLPDSAAKEVYLDAVVELDRAFCRMGAGKAPELERPHQLVEKLVKRVMDNDPLMLQMAMLKDIDNYSLVHSVNVSIFAVLLGYFLKLTEQELTAVGMGALFHDIGKSKIPQEILAKPGTLSDEEFVQIKMHPVFGYEALKGQGLPIKALACVLQHHERNDGSGYPDGLKKREIDRYAKITAVADMYDALTTDRSYRTRMLPHEGAEILMADGSLNKLEREFVAAFLQNIPLYPVGSVVVLNTGEIARIESLPTFLPMRPTVKILTRERTGQTLELLTNPTVMITGLVEENGERQVQVD